MQLFLRDEYDKLSEAFDFDNEKPSFELLNQKEKLEKRIKELESERDDTKQMVLSILKEHGAI